MSDDCKPLANFSRVASLAYAAQISHPHQKVASTNRGAFRMRLADLLALSLPIRETSTLLLGDMGRHSKDIDLYGILELLLQQLGSPIAPLRSLAYTEVNPRYASGADAVAAEFGHASWQDTLYPALTVP